MDKKLMKTNDRQVSMIIITLIISNVLALIMTLLIKNSKMIILGIMILTSIIIYIMIKQVFTKFYRQLDYLIACSDMIIENNNKHLEIIDGEGKISILSHKLYILNERFFNLIEKINQEKLKLKDYIEDISHQIKTPITSMQINEELLLNQPLNKKQFEKISNIHSQTLKINELIVALLRLAKVESNSIDYDFKDYYLYEIIDNVENVLTPLLLENNVKINFTNDSIQIKCDFIWLSEAIENIIKNCIEINPNDIIDIYCEENDFQKKIFIHDHGNGFDIKDLEHLFERFYTSKNSKGFGIGLALTNEIIKGHYGTIEAENDDGALFIITLPKILAKKKY